MVIAQHLKPARRAARWASTKSLRVDLEMLFGSVVDIARRPRLDDPRASPQQDTAAFGWIAACASPSSMDTTLLETSIFIAHGPSMAESEIITGTLATSGRLDKALAEASGLSRERVKGLIASGAVEVGGNIVTSGSAKVQGEDRHAMDSCPRPNRCMRNRRTFLSISCSRTIT